MSHTPGPWSLSAESVYATRVDGPDGNKVALAQYLLSEGRSTPEAIANARLISAAPDLLEVCEEILEELLDESSPVYLTVQQETALVAAIAKAKEGRR